MNMTPPERGNDRYEILLVSLNERFWLLKGEKHINALLSGSDNFPKPVGCLVFKDYSRLKTIIPGGLDFGSLWLINPNIVTRLKEEKQLVELFPED